MPFHSTSATSERAGADFGNGNTAAPYRCTIGTTSEEKVTGTRSNRRSRRFDAYTAYDSSLTHVHLVDQIDEKYYAPETGTNCLSQYTSPKKKSLIETGEQCEGWQGNCCVKTLQRGIADSACSNAETLTQTW